ncbi:MAG: flippase-like domain-containing protein [Candidatus Bathyarchaeota archaeon]|nr:flippase-like domain-containing protein [Candidatus Bathyarchaeota archaeon]
MTKAKTSSRTKLIVALLVFGFVAFLAYFFFYINPAQVIAILWRTNPIFYAGAFIAYTLFVFFSALTWQRLLNNVSVKITTRKAFLYTWVGLFFDATLPQLGWSGEVSKTYLLSKDSNIDAGKIGATVVGQKIMVMTMTIVALAVGLAAVLMGGYPLPPIVIFLFVLVLALSILALGVIYYVIIRPTATKTLLGWGLRIAHAVRKSWNSDEFSIKAEGLLVRFHGNVARLRANPKGLVQPIIFSVVSFVFEVSVIFLTFIALGQAVPVDKVLIVFTLTGTLQTVGITFFGFPELIMSLSFSALLIPPDLSVSVTLLARVVNLWFRLIVSYVSVHLASIGILRKNGVQKYPV